MRFRRGVADEQVATPNPARFVALTPGVAAIVFGAIAVADTGFDPDHIYTPHETVLTFHHTPLLAIGEIAFGAALLISAAGAYLGRGLMTTLRAGALGLGVVIVADGWPRRLHEWLGVHDRNGWLFVIVGAVGLAAATLLPVTHRRHVVEREEVPVGPASCLPKTASFSVISFFGNDHQPLKSRPRTMGLSPKTAFQASMVSSST